MSECRRKFSLKFQVGGTEAYFVQQQSEQLMKSMFYLCVLGAMTAGALLFFLVPFLGPSPRAADVKALVFGADISFIAVCVVVGLTTKVPRLIACVSPEMREVAVVLVMAYAVVAIFMVDLYYCPKLLGYDPDTLYSEAYFSDTRPLLALSVLMTASHVTLPIRWIVLLPLEVFSCLVYSACAFILGGPDRPIAWSSLLLYICLVLCAAIGRRTIENHQRDALSQLIKERSLRVKTEHMLALVDQAGQSHSPEDVLSTGVSRTETTSSAGEFVKAAEDGNLAGVAAVGRREQWLIEFKDLQTVDRDPLGQGGFGKVIVGFYAGSPAAIKLTNIGSSNDGRSSHDQRLLVALLNEIRIMRRLHHANIASFYGACLDVEDGDAALVLEWVHGPCLEKFILQKGLPDRRLQVKDQFKAIMDTCSAVCYLHSRQPCIVHGDLKGTNIMMERCPGRPDFFRAKLLDFGLSRVLTRHARPLSGSVMWVAPEVIQRPEVPAAVQADIFSFGRLAYFILTRRFPLRVASGQQVIETLRSGSLPCLAWPRTEAVSPLIADWRPWIEECSLQDPDRRPKMEDISLRIQESLQNMDDAEGILGLPVQAAPESPPAGLAAPESPPAERELCGPRGKPALQSL